MISGNVISTYSRTFVGSELAAFTAHNNPLIIINSKLTNGGIWAPHNSRHYTTTTLTLQPHV